MTPEEELTAQAEQAISDAIASLALAVSAPLERIHGDIGGELQGLMDSTRAIVVRLAQETHPQLVTMRRQLAAIASKAAALETERLLTAYQPVHAAASRIASGILLDTLTMGNARGN